MADPELDLPLPGCLNSQARSWCFYQASPLCHLLSLHPRRSTVPPLCQPQVFALSVTAPSAPWDWQVGRSSERRAGGRVHVQ